MDAIYASRSAWIAADKGSAGRRGADASSGAHQGHAVAQRVALRLVGYNCPMGSCPFCDLMLGDDAAKAGEDVVVLRDRYPVSPGHTLVVPARHAADFFVLPEATQAAAWRAVAAARESIAAVFNPDGFNVGLNVGAAAGQTVAHAHIHVIPRYAGDVVDPRGGIRWVLPNAADYWS